MTQDKERQFHSLFPLVVSGIMLLLTALAVILTFRLQGRIFLSAFDVAVLNLFTAVVALLDVIWLLLLLFAGLGLSFGVFYKLAKWNLFFVCYPLALLCPLLRLCSKPSLQTSFLEFQNRLFRQNFRFDGKPRTLILLPHCLQNHDCRVRITRDISDCEECGCCDISELKKLGMKYDIPIGIANGGTLARKIVRDSAPDVVIAVACHRDLTDGVRESWKYPVYAILNRRPFGPCYDTTVDVERVSNIVNSFFGEHETSENSQTHR